MVRSTKALIDAVHKLAREHLEVLGMRKRSGEIFTSELNPEVIGWLGLHRAVGRGQGWLEVNPVVGVRHQPLEKTRAEISGKKFHPYLPPTKSIHVGYLTPRRSYTPWIFTYQTQNEVLIDDMVKTINHYGRVYAAENADLHNLIQEWTRPGFVGMDYDNEALIVAYALLGEYEAAQRRLLAHLEKIEDRKDGAAENFRKFGRSVVDRFPSMATGFPKS